MLTCQSRMCIRMLYYCFSDVWRNQESPHSMFIVRRSTRRMWTLFNKRSGVVFLPPQLPVAKDIGLAVPPLRAWAKLFVSGRVIASEASIHHICCEATPRANQTI